ncbi:hypothetical protein L596_006400 [Steinernema carpocapsae]|uniref:Uncharacterized protein n=1 Tax=Steinernema carpocapsae TaxID=34508 RepID=A0A4V6I8Z0_STECR|nr:hypothetical protein L596_006400 [Steinernema carpocapsae]
MRYYCLQHNSEVRFYIERPALTACNQIVTQAHKPSRTPKLNDRRFMKLRLRSVASFDSPLTASMRIPSELEAAHVVY